MSEREYTQEELDEAKKEAERLVNNHSKEMSPSLIRILKIFIWFLQYNERLEKFIEKLGWKLPE